MYVKVYGGNMNQTTTYPTYQTYQAYPQYEVRTLVEHPQMINGDFLQKDILSLDQFSAADLHRLFRLAEEMKQLVLNHQPSSLLSGYMVSLLFFEPSSRT